MIGDISKPDTAARLLYGTGDDVDIIHTAGIIHPSSTRQFYEVNTNGTRNVAQAALDHGVRRMVHVSSNSPFGTNPRPSDTFRAIGPYHPYYGYGRSKMQAELAVMDALDHGLGDDRPAAMPPVRSTAGATRSLAGCWKFGRR